MCDTTRAHTHTHKQTSTQTCPHSGASDGAPARPGPPGPARSNLAPNWSNLAGVGSKLVKNERAAVASGPSVRAAPAGTSPARRRDSDGLFSGLGRPALMTQIWRAGWSAFMLWVGWSFPARCFPCSERDTRDPERRPMALALRVGIKGLWVARPAAEPPGRPAAGPPGRQPCPLP